MKYFSLRSCLPAAPSQAPSSAVLRKKKRKKKKKKKENPLVIELPTSYRVAAWLLVQVAPGAGPCMI